MAVTILFPNAEVMSRWIALGGADVLALVVFLHGGARGIRDTAVYLEG
ncbi:MAG: hypothetical protein ACPGVG_00110 [Mycobacterium sp.]